MLFINVDPTKKDRNKHFRTVFWTIEDFFSIAFHFIEINVFASSIDNIARSAVSYSLVVERK